MESEQRIQVEREVHEQFMRDIASGNFEIHGMKWDTIIAGIRNLDQLGQRKTTEDRIHEIIRLKAAEAEVARLREVLTQIRDTAGGEIREDTLTLNSKLRDVIVLAREGLLPDACERNPTDG